jgi:hypothetical protein
MAPLLYFIAVRRYREGAHAAGLRPGLRTGGRAVLDSIRWLIDHDRLEVVNGLVV